MLLAGKSVYILQLKCTFVILIFFPMSRWCFCASLVKIHQLVQEKECGQASFYSVYSVVTLKIKSKSPKSNKSFKLSQQYNMWSLVHERGCRQAFLVKIWKFQSAGVTLKMRSRSPKSNHFFSVSQYDVCASLVKIHPLIQEIECRQEATRTPTGSALKTICPLPPPPFLLGGGIMTSQEQKFLNFYWQTWPKVSNESF